MKHGGSSARARGAAVHLLGAGRAAAAIAGRDFLTPDDVVRLAPRVLVHRLLLSPAVELERFSAADAVEAALAAALVPR